ncbi:Xaa-Pro peptidase family protein [Brevundimonas sp.]|uniref:M24 family metallopeptidase n=1 Tax=Brevundimonas sp. TaxID=1871086 RepID=UPI00122ABD8D|nr:Xaa-Pro peptidase family protein [Brevundimonas sp.]TAJ57520.1 MAG: aminopeptidase P family protein [Brevundimonas sp.]
MTSSSTPVPAPIGAAERQARLAGLRSGMEAAGVGTVLLGSTSSLRYFTGVDWYASERLVGALVHASGGLDYITPRFELEKVEGLISLPGDILTWEEDESPWQLVADRIGLAGRMAVDERMALAMYRSLRAEIDDARLADAAPLIHPLRSRKSPAEIALMSHAKAITIEVHRRAHDQLHAGQRASEVVRFIDEQHRALGGSGNSFCIVSFGEDTSLPHGGEGDRALARGDVVLIDTGTRIDGYSSDITRTYVFGEAAPEMRRVWEAEKRAQAAAFEAARPGASCEAVDAAARRSLEADGFGPGYSLPGLPHRTGHGIGLDIHEGPYLVKGDATPLATGMCFSNEPMIVVPGRFGVRLEDHFHMTDAGPQWFTRPQHSLDEPFADVPAWPAS